MSHRGLKGRSFLNTAFLTALSLLTTLAPLSAPASVLTLEQMQERAQASVEQELAESQSAVAKADADAQRARGGPSWVLGAGFGTTTEPVTDEQSRSFVRGSLRAGLRFPLLGAVDRQREQLSLLERRAVAGEVGVSAAKRQSLRDITKVYVSYWAAAEKIVLTQRFLRFESEFARLAKERTQVGFLLQADRIEFMSQFDVARRDLARLELEKQAYLRELNALAAVTELEFDAILPEQNRGCRDSRPPQGTQQDDAEMAMLQAQWEGYRGAAKSGWTHWVEADVRLESSLSQDYPSLQWGDGLGMSLNLSMPWEVNAVVRAEHARANADQRQIELLMRQRNETTQRELHAVAQRAATADIGLRFAAQRMRAAIEGVRLAALRAQHMEGDVLERLQIRRYDYYRAAMEFIDARAEHAAAQRLFVSYGAVDCVAQNKTASVSSPSAEPKSPTLGVYVWQGVELQQLDKKNNAFSAKLAQAGVARVLMSLDASQLSALKNAPTRESLKNFLWSAQQAHLRVDLLLGDPAWILPAHRDQLLEIVRALSDLPFAGLQLDLEPEQLPNWEADSARVLAELMHTLQAAAEVSPWPLGLSAHPRWFSPQSELGCLACWLPALGVGEVSLMIYRTDAAQVVSTVRPILQAFPDLQFSVAQSVERELGEASSFATRGKQALRLQFEALKAQLAAPNFAGVLIQDWQQYQGLSP